MAKHSELAQACENTLELRQQIDKLVKNLDLCLSTDIIKFDHIQAAFGDHLYLFSNRSYYKFLRNNEIFRPYFWRFMIEAIIEQLDKCQVSSRLESAAGWFSYEFTTQSTLELKLPDLFPFMDVLEGTFKRNVGRWVMCDKKPLMPDKLIGSCFVLALFSRMYQPNESNELFKSLAALDTRKTYFYYLPLILMHPKKFHVQARIFASHALLCGIDCFQPDRLESETNPEYKSVLYDQLSVVPCECADQCRRPGEYVRFINTLRQQLKAYKRNFGAINSVGDFQEFQAIILLRLLLDRLSQSNKEKINDSMKSQFTFMKTSDNEIVPPTIGSFLIGTNPIYSVYRLAIPANDESGKLYIELKLLTVGSIKIAIGPHVENLNCILDSNDDFVCWDPMDIPECDKTTGPARRIPKHGSVIGVKFLTKKKDPRKKAVRFFLNNFQVNCHHGDDNNINWANGQYLYVALSLFQQVIVCVHKDSWKYRCEMPKHNPILSLAQMNQEEVKFEFPILDGLIVNPKYGGEILEEEQEGTKRKANYAHMELRTRIKR